MSLRIHGFHCEIVAQVIPKLADGIDLILGSRWMREHSALLDFGQGTCMVTRHGRSYRLQSLNRPQSEGVAVMNYVTAVLHAATSPSTNLVSLKQIKKLQKQGVSCYAAFITSDDIAQLNAMDATTATTSDPTLVSPDKLEKLLEEYKEGFEPLTGLGPDLGTGHTIELEPGKKPPYSPGHLTQEGQTALHLAAAKGFDVVVRELLARRAKTTLQDKAGRTPLHLAAAAGQVATTLELLGRCNRDPPETRSLLLSLRDCEGHCPLLAAVCAGKEGTCGVLLRGMETNRLRLCVDASGRGPLTLAVLRRHVHLLPLLAAAAGGPDTERDPATGGTPLHTAARLGLVAAVEPAAAGAAAAVTAPGGPDASSPGLSYTTVRAGTVAAGRGGGPRGGRLQQLLPDGEPRPVAYPRMPEGAGVYF
ncbi:hypothetical protein VOLCADRAFT_99250 [Volvox carteri f. nagariensis]|uniref:Uncharacterized protein n=1 Tax=Volvox carteri f. nagariensis TaxID=3068 RepID=D8UHC0_VOLCA|nr:uncharacterized protein VOLCADRAFT_99250 [Volvox carteri f. nagariensis]EFJ40904.1 hypothetical protein VOLCADRAFT_99250 [Volvox carteri f. nagariensis]|eukprot:XP_002958064.1 hypothetical protein VOLCADRAFT_99250 [Volvox carteri f. nagariensis]